MTQKEIKKMQRELDKHYDYFTALFSNDKDTKDENLTMLSELVELELELEDECGR